MCLGVLSSCVQYWVHFIVHVIDKINFCSAYGTESCLFALIVTSLQVKNSSFLEMAYNPIYLASTCKIKRQVYLNIQEKIQITMHSFWVPVNNLIEYLKPHGFQICEEVTL